MSVPLCKPRSMQLLMTSPSTVFASRLCVSACLLLITCPSHVEGFVRRVDNIAVKPTGDVEYEGLVSSDPHGPAGQVQLGVRGDVEGAFSGASASSQDSSEAAAVRKGKVFFLFMAMDEFLLVDIWTEFFKGQEVGKSFEIFIHCVDLDKCKLDLSNTSLPLRFVPTVHSEWCEDLVSPMDALLEAALALSGGGPEDKFVFVSDTAVPVKDFDTVWQRLVMDDDPGESNFCVYPDSEVDSVPMGPTVWPLVKISDGSVKKAVYHHQWMVLCRDHAADIVARQGQDGWYQDAYYDLQPQDTKGCLDEFAYFKRLFGFVNRTGTQHVEGLVGSTIQPELFEPQGRCDTCTMFARSYVPPYESPGNSSEVLDQLWADADTELKAEDDDLLGLGVTTYGIAHPIGVLQFSKKSLEVLEKSPFLFFRKVEPGSTFSAGGSLAEAFQKYVFKTSSSY